MYVYIMWKMDFVYMYMYILFFKGFLVYTAYKITNNILSRILAQIVEHLKRVLHTKFDI